jgi:hypothetical protein
MPDCNDVPNELQDQYIEIPTLEDMVGNIYYNEPSSYVISTSPYAYMGEPTYYEINGEEPTEEYMLYSTPESQWSETEIEEEESSEYSSSSST